ncbi:MAG: transposase [Candidatus Korobacteraceae bacterium]
MSHTHSHNLLHCVFSTKDRLPLIRDPEALWPYTVGLADNKGIHVVAAGGTTNHAHLLILLPQTIALAKAMQEIKANTSRWLRETSRIFQWQEGYGAFSVSHSQREAVVKYIANQVEHHNRRSYEHEFVALLRKSGVNYDPRFVFG